MEEDLRQSLARLMQRGQREIMRNEANILAEKEKVENKLFFSSIVAGNNRSVHAFLLKGMSPDVTNEEGRSGLHFAALSSHQDVFSTLLNRGADPEKSDNSGITPLMCAAQVGSAVIVTQLLDRDVDVSKKTNDGLTAVFYALFNGHTKIAKLLEEKRSCIHQLSEEPTTSILAKAVTKNWVKVVRFMHDQNCDVAYRHKLILASQAGLCGHTEMLQYFKVKYSDKVEDDGRSPLRCAVQNGYCDAVKYMLDNDCDVSQNEEFTKTAILTGHLDILKLLREKGAPIFKKDKQNITPVQLAIAQGSFELFKYLVEQGCSLEPHEEQGNLALMAASVRQTEIVEFFRFLAEHNVNLNEQDAESGETTLLAISQKGPIQAVEFLIDHGCDLNARNRRGVTPALRAAHNKQEDILMMLGEKGAELDIPNRMGETAILCAARNKSLSMVRYLAEKGCRLDAKDANGHTVAFYAVKENNVALLNFLREKKICLDEPDSNGMTPLIISVRNGAFDAIKVLTSKANLCSIDHKDRSGKTALHHAVSSGKLDIVKYLTEKGADPRTIDNAGNTLLLEALKHKKTYEILQFLTKNGCEIQATNRELKTAMHYACMLKENDALMHLLDIGCPFDTHDQDGMTPFMISAAQGSESLITVLKSVGADVNRRNHRGENVVHLAVKSGNLKIVQFFSLFGCALDQEDNNGITPLMIACTNNKLEMARFLINKKADVNAVARNGRTPAHFACESGSMDLLKLLYSSGAKVNQLDLNDVTPVFLAAAKQDKNFLFFLLSDAGCSVAATDKALKTVLHYAVEGKNPHQEAIQFILEQKLDPNALDETNTSPVMLSVKIGSDSVLAALRSKGGRIDETFDQEGRSIAHLACEAGNLKILQEIQGLMSLSSRTTLGENCLTIACASGHEDILSYLIQQKVHVNYKNALGDSALIVAAKNSHLKLIPLLLKAGAKAEEVNNEGNNAAQTICAKPCTSKLDKVKVFERETNEHLEDLKRSIEEGVRRQDSIKPKLLDIVAKTKELPKHLVKSNLPPGCISKKAAIKCLQALFDSGANVNSANLKGEAALHFAAKVGSRAIIQFLLSQNARVDPVDNDGETPLFSAIRHGKERAVQLLLDRGADATATNKKGLSALSLAVALNCVKSIELLHEKGAQLSIEHVVGQLKLKDIFKHRSLKQLEFLLDNGFDGKKTESSQTIVHTVVWAGDIQLLKALRANPKCTFLREILNDQDSDGNTAFHQAIIMGRLDMAEVLLELQCRTDLRNSSGRTPLHVAVVENKLKLVQWLFEHCKIVFQPDAVEPEPSKSPLHLAAAIGNLDMFKYLQSKGYKCEATCGNQSNSAHYAAIHGNLHILQHILDTNPACIVTENAQKLTPFQCAVLNGQEEAASFLHQNAADPGLPDCIIHLSVQSGHQHMTDWLLKRGAPMRDVDENTGEETVRFAIASGNLHMVQKAISGMPDWQNASNNHKNSLAQSAAFFGHCHLLRFLKENNAPMDSQDLDGDTPILECASTGHLESLKLLLEYGCNIHHKNAMGRDIVHLACIVSNKNAFIDIVKFAHDQELPLDDPDNDGTTGLMYACRQGFKDMVKFLLGSGRCDLNKSNNRRLTAAHLAVVAGRTEILELLSQNGGYLDAVDVNGSTPLMYAVYRSNLSCVKFLMDHTEQHDGDRRNRIKQLAARASPDVRLELERQGFDLPPPEPRDQELAVTDNEIVLDINLLLCAHNRQNAMVPEEGNVAVQELQQLDDNDIVSNFGGIPYGLSRSAQDLTLNDTWSTVNLDGNSNRGDEEADEDEDHAGLGVGAAAAAVGQQLDANPAANPLQQCSQQ